MERVAVFIIAVSMLLSGCQSNLESKISLVGTEVNGEKFLIDWDIEQEIAHIEPANEARTENIPARFYWENGQEISIEDNKIKIDSIYDGKEKSEIILMQEDANVILGYNAILVSNESDNASRQNSVTVYANGNSNVITIELNLDMSGKPIAAIHYDRKNKIINVVSSDFNNDQLVDIEFDTEGKEIETYFIEGPVFSALQTNAMPYPLFPQEAIFINKNMYFFYDGINIGSINIETKEYNENQEINKTILEMIMNHSEQGYSGVYIDFAFRCDDILLIRERYPEHQVEYILAFHDNVFVGALIIRGERLFLLNDKHEEKIISDGLGVKSKNVK